MEPLEESMLDLSDPLQFAMFRWDAISSSSLNSLSLDDRQKVSDFGSYDAVVHEMRSKIKDPNTLPSLKRMLITLHTLPGAVLNLTRLFETYITPHNVESGVLWGFFYLILEDSCDITTDSTIVPDILTTLRRNIELFYIYLEGKGSSNEMRTALSEFLETLLDIFMKIHMQCPRHHHDGSWSQVRLSLDSKNRYLAELTKHVKSFHEFSSTLSPPLHDVLQHERGNKANNIEAAEQASQKPCDRFVLPLQRNTNFYGRQHELNRILKHISPRPVNSSSEPMAYTIYGRRGVGKTSLALQFAYDCIASRTYDFVFWVKSETMVSTRQSFAAIAKSLQLEMNESSSQDHDILFAIHDWMRKTDQAWLLIFDNIENESILRLHWPVHAPKGSILITSRDYHPFIRRVCSHGDTLKPFEGHQSWELLLALLGDDWRKTYRGEVPQAELAAGNGLLLTLEGLALAIEQTANMIKDEKFGGRTMTGTFDAFKLSMKALPERHSKPRSASERALDALWDITFQHLSWNSRALLSLLAWFSPDGTSIDMLDLREGHSRLVKESDSVEAGANDGQYLKRSLRAILTSSSDLQTAVSSLSVRNLIKTQSQNLIIHRVVQEAVSFQNTQSLQDSFDFAASLLISRFPAEPPPSQSFLHQEWSLCQRYINHVIYMAKAFSQYCRSGVLKASEDFIEMLNDAGCGFLCEIGDYDTCELVISVARSASSDINSEQYARLLVTDGGRLYEQNRLSECRTAWKRCLQIREARLPNDCRQIADILTNIGNLELAAGKSSTALPNYLRAQELFIQCGETVKFNLALARLNIGRLYTLQGNFDEAIKYIRLSETVLQHSTGSSRSFLVHVHYAYGKIYLFQRKPELARKSFQECLQIGLRPMPTHPITCAAWYSMACVEGFQGNREAALANLDKARQIAAIRSPIRHDGTMARILWRIAFLMETDPDAGVGTDAIALKDEAERIKRDLIAAGEGGQICRDHGFPSSFFGKSEEEDAYDALVPLFFR